MLTPDVDFKWTGGSAGFRRLSSTRWVWCLPVRRISYLEKVLAWSENQQGGSGHSLRSPDSGGYCRLAGERAKLVQAEGNGVEFARIIGRVTEEAGANIY